MKVAKINADWGSDDIRIIVGRNINGITLNGYEYITDNNNFLIGFISEKSARDYLHRHGISDNDIQYLEFFYRTECPNCGEEVIVKIYDAKIENGFKTIECSNCKTKIKFETEEKEMNENKENINVLTEDAIIELSNTEKRMNFLNDYQNWGVWLNIEQIGVKVYKAVLPDGSIIYVTEFPMRGGCGRGYTVQSFRYAGSDGRYQSHSDSESILIQRLKDLKVKIVSERRNKNAES